jgi:hypothetical protein
VNKQIDYTVHSAVVEKVPVTASYNGQEISALVDGLTVELVSNGDMEHGHTFRFVPKGDEDLQAHRDMFAVGKKLRATFESVEEGAST